MCLSHSEKLRKVRKAVEKLQQTVKENDLKERDLEEAETLHLWASLLYMNIQALRSRKK